MENTGNPQNIQITLNTPNANNQSEKKKVSTLIVKIISGTLVIASAALLCYSAFLLINQSKESATNDSYITLNGKTIQESKTVYSEFGIQKKKKASDFALLGSKFFLSESKITPSLLSSGTEAVFGQGSKNLYLYNLTSKQSTFALGQTDTDSHRYYIDLNGLSEGDFLCYSSTGPFASNKDYHPYSLSTNQSINYTTYTLPNSDGIRKRITIRNNKESPYLLLNVKNCGSTLPTKNYDVVIFPAEYTKKDSTLEKTTTYTDKEWESLTSTLTEKLPKRYKVKFASSLQEAYDTNATLSIAIGKQDGDYTSTYIATSTSSYLTDTLTDGTLKGYDTYPEIREMASYLGKAGENNSEVIGNDVETSSDLHTGKESYLLSEDKIEEKIISLLSK